MKKPNLNLKPSLTACPKRFCFFWCDDNEACGCSFGQCFRRIDLNPMSHDNLRGYYEPCEPDHDMHNVPILYFCDPKQLTNKAKISHKIMARKLWKK